MNDSTTRRIYVLGICGVIVLAATIVISNLVQPEQCEISVLLGRIFLLLAELVFFGGLISLEYMEDGSQIVSRVGCGTCIIGYAVLGSIFSIIYMTLNTDSVKPFVILQIILGAICIILFLIFKMVSQNVKEEEERVLDHAFEYSQLVENIENLKNNPKYGDKIKQLSDEIKYLDHSVGTETDGEIARKIAMVKTALEQDPYSVSVEEELRAISSLLEKRKYEIRNKKMGGI